MQILHLYRLPHKGGNIKGFTYLLCSKADSPSPCSLLPARIVLRDAHSATQGTREVPVLWKGSSKPLLRSLCGAGTLSHGCSGSEAGGASRSGSALFPAPEYPRSKPLGWSPSHFCLRVGSCLAEGLQDPMESSGSTAKSLCVFSERAAGLRNRLTPGRG